MGDALVITIQVLVVVGRSGIRFYELATSYLMYLQSLVSGAYASTAFKLWAK